MDGYLAEYYSGVMSNIFEHDTKYFLLNTYENKNAEIIYGLIIYKKYMNEIESKKYPSNIKEIQSYGDISNNFLKTYNKYLEKGF